MVRYFGESTVTFSGHNVERWTKWRLRKT